MREIWPSLNTFFAATIWPRTPLARAIALVLAIKLIGIIGMRIFMFPDSSQPVIDATAMMRVIGPTTLLP